MAEKNNLPLILIAVLVAIVFGSGGFFAGSYMKDSEYRAQLKAKDVDIKQSQHNIDSLQVLNNGAEIAKLAYQKQSDTLTHIIIELTHNADENNAQTTALLHAVDTFNHQRIKEYFSNTSTH